MKETMGLQEMKNRISELKTLLDRNNIKLGTAK